MKTNIAKRLAVMLCLAAGIAVCSGAGEAQQHYKPAYLTPKEPGDGPWEIELQALDEILYDITIAGSGERDGKTYVLKWSKITDLTGPDEFIWKILDSNINKYNLNFASRKFGADARRAGSSCIRILQAPRNEADAPKSRDRFTRRTSAFLCFIFITSLVKDARRAKKCFARDLHWKKLL